MGFLSQIYWAVNPIILIAAVASPVWGIFSQNPRTGAGPVALEILDLDEDGDAEVVVSNSLGDTISLLYGLGGGSFSDPVDFPVGVTPGPIASGDVDHDGLTDIIVANVRDETVSLLRAVRLPSAVGLSSAATVASGLGAAGIVVTDLNRDGRLDLVILNRGTSQIALLDGSRGWGALQLSNRIATAIDPVALTAGDLNRDGRADLVVASRNANVVSVFLGDGRGGFAARTDYAAGRTPTSVYVGDATGDGRFDIVVANEQVDTASLLVGDGTGRLTPANPLPVGGAPLRALIADVSGDRIADILVVNSFSNTVSTLLGRRSGGFAGVDFTVGTTPLDLGIADVNDDGKPDVITVNYDEDNLSLLLNTGDYVVLAGDVDGSGQVGPPDIALLLTEVFDGDGDSPIDAPTGFVVTGAAADANSDAHVTVADLVEALRSLRR